MVMVRPSRLATAMASISFMLWTRPIVRSVYSVGPTFIEPLGICRFCDSSARATSATVSLWARSFIGSRLTLICRAWPPTSITWPTPLIVSNCRRSTLSQYSVMSRIVAGGGADTAIFKMGVESGSSFSTVGCSMSLGKSGKTRFTLSRTSCAATSPSFSSTN